MSWGGLEADALHPTRENAFPLPSLLARTCSQSLPIETSSSVMGGINIHKAGKRETLD